MSTTPESTMMDELLGRIVAESPADTDVLFGRGGKTNTHPANIKYLEQVAQHEVQYMNCMRKFQKLMSLCIIHRLRVQGARFMEKSKNGTWKSVCLSRCREKVSQRLRERIPFLKLEERKAALAMKAKPTTSSSVEVMVESQPLPTRVVEMPPMDSIAFVSDVSSGEEDSLFGSADFDEVSLFTFRVADQKDDDTDTISVVSSALMEETFDNPFDAAEEQFVLKRELAAIVAEEEDQGQRKRQKRDDDDYSYGTVIECFHDEDSLMGDFSDVFEAVRDDRVIPGHISVAAATFTGAAIGGDQEVEPATGIPGHISVAATFTNAAFGGDQEVEPATGLVDQVELLQYFLL